MNRLKLSIVIIFVVIIAGFSVFFIIVNQKTHIEIRSFDRTSYLSFGEHKVKDFVSDDSNMSINFEIDNVESFTDEVLLKNNSYYKSENSVIYFIKDGYIYYSIVSDNRIYVYNLVSCFSVYAFPFYTTYSVIESREEDNYYDWDFMSHDSNYVVSFSDVSNKDDLLNFYSMINPVFWKYDVETEIIYLKSYQCRAWVSDDEDRLSSDYTISISIFEDGFTVKAIDLPR